MTSFSAQVDAWVLETEERLEAVFKTAVQETVAQFVDVWPVDTGFSRASFKMSTSGFFPLVETPANRAGQTIEPYELIIATSEMGDTLFGNFTANYAWYIENGSRGRAGRHLVKLAAQNWQNNVNQAVTRLRS